MFGLERDGLGFDGKNKRGEGLLEKRVEEDRGARVWREEEEIFKSKGREAEMAGVWTGEEEIFKIRKREEEETMETVRAEREKEETG